MTLSERMDQAREDLTAFINEYADILAPQQCAVHGLYEECEVSCFDGTTSVPLETIYLDEWVLVTSFRQYDAERLTFNSALWPTGTPPHHRRGLLTDVLEDHTV